MTRVTGLRPVRSGRVLVELDGAEWRTLRAEAVAAAGVCVGLELDRPLLRRLRRELRRAEALAAAWQALRHRDLSARRLGERLERAGMSPAERAETVETLARLGIVDDERLARARAAALAERGAADAAIRHDLERQGLDRELVARALDELEPEALRAERIAAALGGGVRAARTLARKGFGEESIEAVVRTPVADEP